MRIASCVDRFLTIATRLIASEVRSAARATFTRLAICCDAATARGSNSSERSVHTQAMMPLPSRIASSTKVRQKRLRATPCERDMF